MISGSSTQYRSVLSGGSLRAFHRSTRDKSLARGLAQRIERRFRVSIDNAQIDDNLGAASSNLETREHVLEAGLLFGF